MSASDYYFKYNTRGARFYYDKVSGKRIRKDQIPPDVLEQIQEKCENLEELINLRNGYLKEIAKWKQKLAEVNLRIQTVEGSSQENSNQENSNQESSSKQSKMSEENIFEQFFGPKHQPKIHQRNRSKTSSKNPFEEFFGPHFSEFKDRFNNYNENNVTLPVIEEDILGELNIQTKEEWKQWLRKNHPDRGGDHDTCIRVILAGKTKKW